MRGGAGETGARGVTVTSELAGDIHGPEDRLRFAEFSLNECGASLAAVSNTLRNNSRTPDEDRLLISAVGYALSESRAAIENIRRAAAAVREVRGGGE